MRLLSGEYSLCRRLGGDNVQSGRRVETPRKNGNYLHVQGKMKIKPFSVNFGRHVPHYMVA